MGKETKDQAHVDGDKYTHEIVMTTPADAIRELEAQRQAAAGKPTQVAKSPTGA